MPIDFTNNIFHLYNEGMSYCIQLSPYKDLLHLHWGKRVRTEDLDMIYKPRASFSAYEGDDYTYSLDVLPQEYPAFGAQDLRSPAYGIRYINGDTITKARYAGHKIYNGKKSIQGLPALYANAENEAQTLEITLCDNGLEIILYYTIYEHYNAITRHVEIKNTGNDSFAVTSAMSASIDFINYDYKYLHLHGAWARERQIEISRVRKGFQGVDSKRGASGVAENPFIAIMEPNATEDFGHVYGFSLIYSGNFKLGIEVEQYGTMRVQAGINPFNFEWELRREEVFYTPEVVMVYSDSGLGKMSRTYHNLYRKNLCISKFTEQERPVLINNWEATYFDFDHDKLISIVKKAKELGIEMFVLDDGWFGKRNDDTSSLGDWFANKEKLPKGIEGLAKDINNEGLTFGIWVEPEMISPDSQLFTNHPDWVIGVPGKTGHKGRHQYILDLTREEVTDYVIEALCKIFESADIRYVKWDMNRNMTDIYSLGLPNHRQGEVAHRYILSLYHILDTVTKRFPDILFEGCSGGGGRFDPGILHYMPQMWASDDTDAVERFSIQYATSLVYPASCVCAHVSDVPNHQVGRVTPLDLRGLVAMNGALGYEFDLDNISDDVKADIRAQIVKYKKYRGLILSGNQYRLLDPFSQRSCSWMFVSDDRKHAIVFYFNKLAVPNAPLRRLKLKGLVPKAVYKVDGKEYMGESLMNYGLSLPSDEKDFESKIWHIDMID